MTSSALILLLIGAAFLLEVAIILPFYELRNAAVVMNF
tara:strand:+ start:281 stop:394 length:114 start_codon:yes stop_codon:yes gene_type:complete